jgi:biofilm PGA synthesis lipoprotein PgaB
MAMKRWAQAMMIVFLGFVAATPGAAETPIDGARLLVLCYHDVPKEVNLDKYGVDHEAFVQQIEYLRTHGYTFVSAADVIDAQKGAKELPAKAVLLTFDDAYATFYDFVLPVLKLYGIPCVLGVVTSWIDEPPAGLPGPLMSWAQLKEAAGSGLVEIASHSDKLHRAVIYNPYGNTSWAAVSRI